MGTDATPDPSEEPNNVKYPRRRFIEALRKYDGRASSGEIASVVGCTPQLVSIRMREFEEKGWVTRREVGRANLWILTEDS
jgi:DNA-binding MarR family transcriptional regulator